MLRPWRAVGLTVLLGLGCTEANPFLNEDSDTDDTSGTEATTAATETSTTVGPTSTSTATSTSSDDTAATDPPGTDSMAVTTSVTTTDPTVGEVSSSGGPAVCPQTHACVPRVVPNGWSGPAVLALSDPGSEPACPADYPMLPDALQPKAGLLAPAAICGCECGGATGTSCAAAVLEHHATDVGCGAANINITVGASCTDIVNQSGGQFWQVDEPLVNAGSCSPMPSQELPAVGFSSNVTICDGAVDIGGCDEREACVPLAPGDEVFEDLLCLYRAGDHMCPEGEPYDVRTVYYEGTADGRGCSECTCGDATGSCTGSVALHNAAACDGQGAGTVGTGGCVQGLSGLSVSAARWTQSGLTASCTPSPTAPVGAAEPTDPVTVCCIG